MLMSAEDWMKAYLLVALIAFVISGFAQANKMTQERLASRVNWQGGTPTDWPLARRWQIEISGWNWGASIIIIGALKSSDPEMLKYSVGGVVFLTLRFGLNHIKSYFEDKSVPDWHFYVGSINLVGAMFGAIVLGINII